MEIPYTVKSRPDTGLFNAKIGIWLFLASEVMLFGGLFSGYVFLRLGSDADPNYFWPFHSLDLIPGLVNTVVLISSSVFVVLAWSELKLRNWVGYQRWMFGVLACALCFMGIKSYEYWGKLTHYGIRLKDQTVLAGHNVNDNQKVPIVDSIQLDLTKTDFRVSKYIQSAAGDEATFSTEFRILIPSKTWEDAAVSDEVLNQAIMSDSAVLKQKNVLNALEEKLAGKVFPEKGSGFIQLRRSEVMSLKKQIDRDLRDLHLAKIALHRAANVHVEDFNRRLMKDWTVGSPKPALVKTFPVYGWHDGLGVTSLTFSPSAPIELNVRHRDCRNAGDNQLVLQDFTLINGKRDEESRYLRVAELDLIDLRATEVLESSMAFNFIAENSNPFHSGSHANHSLSEKGGESGGKLTSAEILAKIQKDSADSKADWEEKHNRADPDKKHLKVKLDHVPAAIPFDSIQTYSNFGPKQNTFYATYFTLTGLHGLHVIIGALVLAHFTFSKKLYQRKPDQLTNRVEVGGLFWHFVDLVWIFLFPILYLM